MRFKTILLAISLTYAALGQTSSLGTTVEGVVFQVEPTAVYVTIPDTTAIRVPLTSTFFLAGRPVPAGSLHNGDHIRVEYATEAIEIIAGPVAPGPTNAYFHRSIKRGARVLDQNYSNGIWQDVP